MRWYSDILARTNSRTISIHDVYNFLNNFKIPEDQGNNQQDIFQILHSINIGEFCIIKINQSYFARRNTTGP